MRIELAKRDARTPRVTGFNGKRKTPAHTAVVCDGVTRFIGTEQECLAWLETCAAQEWKENREYLKSGLTRP